MPFTADPLITRILALAPDASGYWVAFSGGLDSQTLLHALATRREQLPASLGALHVNHNLQPDAPAWAEHCRAVCASLGIDYRVISVQAQPQPGESPEAAARAARYRALAAVVPAGGVLLTAHHQDDQAETLLLQLLRGAGPKGLAAMPERTTVEGVLLLRPLLDVSREALHEYARQHDLTWVEDPSNARTEYDRNFLRHEILPRMQTRWPAAGATLTRSARHQAEAALLLEELAEMDLANGGQTPISPAMPISPVMEDVACQHTKKLGSDPHFPLAVSRLLALNPPRRANLLRHWLHLRHAPTPSTAVLERIDRDVVRAAEDAQPLVSWAGVRLRRYRGALFLDDVLEEIDPSYCLEWWVDQPLTLPGGVLSAVHARGEGVAVRHLQAGSVEVRYRQGGESLQPVGRREHHRLKQLFQEAGVPPWERARVPLIYHHDTLIAVAGYWLCEGFQAGVDEPGVRFSWSRAIVPTGSFW